MTKLSVLQELSFGQRVAEEEGDSLASYFVETDHWRRLYSGQVDVIYGPKGAGKSALYFLLMARTDELFDRSIILTPAENPRGAPAFKDLVTNPPASEREFVALWKLFFLSLISATLTEVGIDDADAMRLHHALAAEGLVRGPQTLARLLRSVVDYVRAAFRLESMEAGLTVDPITGVPAGFTGKISFHEPDAKAARGGVISIDELFALADTALGGADYSLWLLIDRLDVAFAESSELEQNALRALFRVYLDLLAFPRLAVKIFLRTDIWRRITESGFREGSHITKHMTIDWNRNSLLNLVVRRAATNRRLLEFYDRSADDLIGSTESQEEFFYRVYPEQVDVGPNKPRAFEWMLSRTRDGSQANAPRELIHFLNSLRDQQVRRLEIGEAEPEGDRLFDRASFKDALPEVSRTRLEQTVYSEFPKLKNRIEMLRNEKTLHTAESLAAIWQVTVDEAALQAKELVEVGLFEQRGDRRNPQFWVPFLYRDALSLVQGAAD